MNILQSYPFGRRWYLVRTVRYGEAAAVSAIADLHLETYLPHETHFARHGRSIRRVTMPLFRGYVFTRFDVERDRWSEIRRAHSVDDIVCANEVPLRVPDREITVIRAAELAGAYDLTLRPLDDGELKPGASVRITAGAFTGRLARVARLTPKQRVEILLRILGRETRIKIERMHLARV